MRYILLALLAPCAVDELDSTEQDVFASSTTNTNAVDTGWAWNTSDCVLSAVAGNLGPGVQDGYVVSTARVTNIEISIFHYPTFRLYAHGGKTSAGWANNLVRGDATCTPYPEKLAKSWPGPVPANGVPPPVRMTDLATNRRCFLTGVAGGNNAFWLPTDSVRVRQITTPDATHPTTGWYLEGTLSANPSARAFATCIDFPSIAAEWYGAFGGATNTMTSGTGTKMCGLTAIYGVFATTNEGAILNAPRTQTGNWTMTVSPGKFAEADCIQ